MEGSVFWSPKNDKSCKLKFKHYGGNNAPIIFFSYFHIAWESKRLKSRYITAPSAVFFLEKKTKHLQPPTHPLSPFSLPTRMKQLSEHS